MTSARRHYIHLDMLRGLAALAVVVGHIRGFLYLDYSEIGMPGLGHIVFYFATGLGHQAVIAFFALSGFLVGGKVLDDMRNGRWSIAHHMVARLARLWTVVVPALLLTVLWDAIGHAFGGQAGYEGVYAGVLASGPTAGEPADYRLTTLIANVLFLQTIVAPTFGTNGPLWSLAYEFWYYVFIPLLAASLLVRVPVWRRLATGALGLAIALLLPRSITVLGVIWAAGAVGHGLLASTRARVVFASRLYASAAIGLVAGIILLSKADRLHVDAPWPDLALGLAFAALLPALATLPPAGRVYAGIAGCLSDISFTLYATHFPLLAAIWFAGLAPVQWPPGLGTIVVGVAALALALAYAWGLWWCFEARTATVRRAMLKLMGLAPVDVTRRGSAVA